MANFANERFRKKLQFWPEYVGSSGERALFICRLKVLADVSGKRNSQLFEFFNWPLAGLIYDRNPTSKEFFQR